MSVMGAFESSFCHFKASIIEEADIKQEVRPNEFVIFFFLSVFLVTFKNHFIYIVQFNLH